ncbi:MAG: bifunctional adenosylcobinamide kinase/adenosylcobinamide-phosphate guanylyltransferase [Emcibacteraceae bacterium]|nr:bifunctional adenosylcobinamide kinase/adenosylcobinamide-phosphate guanylyltransferase [Emcibacteraceae bacterium]
MMNYNKTLILGGARSGKSRLAEKLAINYNLELFYIATAQARDDEMIDRIHHHIERRGQDWKVIEEPTDIANLIRETSTKHNVLLIDCLTLWLSNLFDKGLNPETEISSLISAINDAKGTIIFVTNEVGQGIVPLNELARNFRDIAGRMNQQIAAAVSDVYFITAGLAQPLKENNTPLTQKFL